ncbi:protein hook [Atheta coriaria]|uniref:protein hook n=1 Tax=Dalotia coriaria TaxID=877792 RepID=UPI0031F41ECA
MEPSEEVSKSLIVWLRAIIPERTRNISEISDGVAILKALIQMSPANFYKLDGKIKSDIGNTYIKNSNLKKILSTIMEFYNDALNLQIMDIGCPDVNKIAETQDLKELGKLLRLVLGCAVHCERKQEYITQIMALEESVQRCIMQAIQELEELTGGVGKSGISLLSLDSETRIMKIMHELEQANEAKEILAQQCHNLESKVQSLQEEKQTLLSENQILATQIKERQTHDFPRGLENRKQIDHLKEEIFRLEVVRDDLGAKLKDQEKDLQTAQDKISELLHAAEVNARLKDEVDALTESAEKVKNLETALASYKKKLEDYADVKKQFKVLEEKNVEYLQQNLKLEEELKKHHSWKNSSDLYKTQASELELKLDEETQRLDKALFQNKNLESKLAAMQAEKERLERERVTLREENDELRLNTNKGGDGAAMAQELAPTEMKERLRFLEKENLSLRAVNQDAEAQQMRLEDATARLKKLTEQNRTQNLRILELEALVENTRLEDRASGMASGDDSLKDCKAKIVQLQEVLQGKEQELNIMQAKYARSVEKAREISISLHGKSNGSIESLPTRHQPTMKEEEIRLMTAAFYRFSSQLHRNAVDEKLALLSAGQGQSFLSRQRQPTPRKPVTPFKSK